jgi:hypothetical protein
LIEKVSDYISIFIESKIPTESINEAVRNQKARIKDWRKDVGKSYKDYLKEWLTRDKIPLERYKSYLGK